MRGAKVSKDSDMKLLTSGGEKGVVPLNDIAKAVEGFDDRDDDVESDSDSDSESDDDDDDE